MSVILTAEIGNSAVKTGLFDKETLIQRETYAFKEIHKLNELLYGKHIKKAMLCSTKRDISFFTEILRQNRIPFGEIDHTIPIPLKLNYSTPGTLGSDRIAAAVGANHLFRNSNVLVIDLGTAITIDFINARNEFEGGNISPGLETRLKSFHIFTDKLPYINKDLMDAFRLTAKNTNEALFSGALMGILFELNGYVHSYKSDYHDLKVVMTGGDAIFFEKKLKYPIFVVQNLSLEGLNRIYLYNAK